MHEFLSRLTVYRCVPSFECICTVLVSDCLPKGKVVISPSICMKVGKCCSKCCRGVTKTLWIRVLNVMPCCLQWNAKVGTYLLNFCALMYVASGS